jgi:signal transduction histidine kinase/ligand-binding sensor domain-containing protein
MSAMTSVMRRVRNRPGSVAMSAALACGFLAWCVPAFALNPSADIGQYAHTAWRIRDGFTSHRITVIAQTPDGYLWLGTEGGLLRFDGVTVVSWQPPAGTSLPSPHIRSLLAARDGTLWIGTLSGLVSWKDRHVTRYPTIDGMSIDSLVEDGAGTTWASGTVVPSGRVCAIRLGDVTCHGEVGRWATFVYQSGGSIWVAAETGLWRWAPGAPRLYRMQEPLDANLQVLATDGAGGLLVTARNGLRRFAHEVDTAIPLPAAYRGQTPHCVFRDRDGAVWVGTRKGLVHIREGRTDVYTRSDGLSGNAITRVFEDREGNIWVTTDEGLDRFRDYAAITMSGRQGMADGTVASILGTRDGGVWLNGLGPGVLSRWSNGHLLVDRSRGLPNGQIGSLFEDPRGRIWASATDRIGYFERDQFVTVNGIAGGTVNAIVEDARGTLWLANWTLGLIRVTSSNEVEQIPWSNFSRGDPASRLAVDPVQGGLWLGFTRGGLAYWADGRVRASYSAADGLGPGRVGDLRVDRDGALWAATQGGLSRVKDGRIVTMTSRHGLPCDGVDSILDDGEGAIWLYMTCGVARLARDDLEGWAAAATNDPRAQPTIRATVLDSSDGIRSISSVSTFSPRTARSSDGRLWFATLDGVSVVDPRRLAVNNLPPPVHIERVIADRQTHDVHAIGSAGLRLPALTRDVRIDYTALSLVAPEKVKFRYKLEGWDRDWQDVGNRREAFYANLPPRTYRFRVIAANNSGVWNETGASLAVSVDPAYYQTTWFPTLVVGMLVAIVWAAHRIRVGIVEKHKGEISALNERLMKAQEQERIRIAGELHDGVMQEMLAVTMMLGTAKRRIADVSEAKATIDKVQEKLIRVGTDIRQLSHDLHPPVLQEQGLPDAVRAYCEQFSASSGIPVSCDADDGVRELSRGAALALFRIVQEALGNAAKHAHAKRITVRLIRSADEVSLAVSDEGAGFDPGRLGTSGGLGLIMMRERASQLNGRFEFDSAPGHGTTIRVVIPFR